MSINSLIGRRAVLAAGMGMAALGIAMPGGAARALNRTAFRDNPFTLGVAAGDPAADGFVIWTRLAPEPLQPCGGMDPDDVELGWEVAADPQFRLIVQQGRARADAVLAHSVHVELAGLQPARPYWYRFIAPGNVISTVGTARTLPAPGAAVQRLRIASAGCQDFERGYYTAFRHLAAEPDLDAVFHYGDYIYELGRRTDNVVRHHLSGETTTLADYRLRHSQYRMDADLQAAHAAAAFIMSFDDHEVDDNWAGRHGKDGGPAALFAARRSAAFRAWYEHMPVRASMWPGLTGSQTWRRFDFGQLLRLHALDTRLHRTRQQCEGGELTAEERAACIPDFSTTDTMLGTEQESWLERGLSQSADWHFLAQQVMAMPYDARKDGETSSRRSTDNWNGYPHARRNLARMIGERAPGRVVIGSGDMHQNVVGHLTADPDRADSAPLAAEFLATSITSGGSGGARHANEWNVLDNNPNVALLNNQRGYHLHTVSPREWETQIRVMDQVDRPGGTIGTLARFVVEQGRPVPQRG